MCPRKLLNHLIAPGNLRRRVEIGFICEQILRAVPCFIGCGGNVGNQCGQLDSFFNFVAQFFQTPDIHFMQQALRVRRNVKQKQAVGETIDIHCGGQDLIFPHHENEIAQSECCNGAPFAHYWMHNGFINVDNRKMSKSLGNFFTVRDVAREYGYEPIRYLMISSQYRSPINYSIDIIEQCKASLARLYSCRDSLDFALKNAVEEPGAEDDAVLAKLAERRKQFEEAMDDDLNTADALAAVYELVRDINTHVAAGVHSRRLCEQASELFDTLCGILGLVYNRAEEKSLDDEIEALIEQRNAARKAKNWAEADRIRDELKARNIILEDTPQGVKWKYAE